MSTRVLGLCECGVVLGALVGEYRARVKGLWFRVSVSVCLRSFSGDPVIDKESSCCF